MMERATLRLASEVAAALVKPDFTEPQDPHDLERVRVVVKSPSKTITSSSIDALEGLQLPPDLTEISIEAGSMPGYHAKAAFYFTPTLSARSGYSIEGRD